MTKPCCRSAALRERAACVRVLRSRAREAKKISDGYGALRIVEAIIGLLDARRAADARKARRKRT